MKPFVLLATRDHDKAAVDEYESVRQHAGLAPDELVHVRVESGPLTGLNLDDYSGVLLGGSPFNISDAVKSDLQLRVESDIRAVVDTIVDADFPSWACATASAPSPCIWAAPSTAPTARAWARSR